MEKYDKFISIRTTTMIYVVIIIFMIQNLLINANSTNINNDNNSVKFERIVDYVSLPYREIKNLTCIPHETTFTCDCGNSDENMNLPPLSGHVYQISVRNCKSLQVSSNLLINTQALRTVEFTNVDNLVLQQNSLSFPTSTSNMPLNLKFNKVQIEKIESHAIKGNIQEISFSSGTIGTILPFGIRARSDGILKFDSMLIDRIEQQAFKKFSVNTLEITNSVITSNLPSKSFYDITITDSFIIHNVTFKEVHTNAFLLEDVSKLIITNNTFDAVDGEWVVAGVKSSILIKDNHFGNTSSLAFKGIKQNKDYIKSERLEFRLISNTIHQTTNEPLPLEFNTDFNLIITNLYYLNTYPCYYKDKKIEFFNTYPDTIYFQSNKDSNNEKLLSIRKTIENQCMKISYLEYIIGGCIGLLILLILIGVLICYCVMKRRKEKNKLDIIVPEPRTYKETQIVLQIENAGLLKTDL